MGQWYAALKEKTKTPHDGTDKTDKQNNLYAGTGSKIRIVGFPVQAVKYYLEKGLILKIRLRMSGLKVEYPTFPARFIPSGCRFHYGNIRLSRNAYRPSLLHPVSKEENPLLVFCQSLVMENFSIIQLKCRVCSFQIRAATPSVSRSEIGMALEAGKRSHTRKTITPITGVRLAIN